MRLMDGILFHKLSCGGNDFILIKAGALASGLDRSRFTRQICHRTMGVGADGTIIIEDDADYPLRMELRNEDGGSAEVSYNGSRCLGFYAHNYLDMPERFSFASDAGEVRVAVKGAAVELEVPAPGIVKEGIELDSPWGKLSGTAVSAGVPYLVVAVPQLEDREKLPAWAASLKHHRFFPDQTNVATINLENDGVVAARFFERGVEQETMSSGTGVVACACYLRSRLGKVSAVDVRCRGGLFPVHYQESPGGRQVVYSAGDVTDICTGSYYYVG